jgi:serine/threonine protein kinase/formylglycine-generating enzyme required for sulfatase activity
MQGGTESFAETRLGASIFQTRGPEDGATAREQVATLRLEAGAMLGEFRLVRKLGEGGMGAVWEAEQTTVGRKVALKLIRPEQVSPQHIEFFHREARAGGRLRHPGIVGVHAAGEIEGVHYIAQELVQDGHDLSDVLAELRKGERLPDSYYDEVAQFCEEVATAMHAAHGAGVIHRDLKPQNILIDGSGAPKVTDFGLARLVDENSLSGEVILGTLFYMSPEQAAAKRRGIDTRADIFSLGVLLYEMLTLRRPFEGDTGPQILEKILGEDPPPPHKVRSLVPTELSVICMKALEKAPEHRYQTMADLARDLRSYRNNESIIAKPPGPIQRSRKWVQRHPTLSVAYTVGVFAFVAISVMLFITFRAKSDLEESNVDLAKARNQAEENAREATRARDVADRRAEDVLRLSAIKEVRDLEARARDLWPAVPEKIPAMDRWLADADDLLGERETFLAYRERLQEKAPEYDPADPASTPVFADSQDAWVYETLSNLIADLDHLADPDPWVGTRASVAARRESARTLHQRSIGDHAEAWEEAASEIFFDERYGELDLAPQLGLVPIGTDPGSGLWEFWHVDSGERPRRSVADGSLEFTAKTGLVLVLIPGGTDLLGAQVRDPAAPNYDPDSRADEVLHEVTLAPFFVSKFEMTQAQWLRTMGSNPSYFGPGEDLGEIDAIHPVEQVSWEEAEHCLRRLGLALPTEAQWEYAARAGTDTPWWCGAAKECLQESANLADVSIPPGLYANETWDDGFSTPAPVGSYLPNPFGLYDVLGNVWEWCQDWYLPYREDPAAGHGLRSLSGEGEVRDRVYRGGGFGSPAISARSARREHFTPNSRDDDLGLRPARPVDEE